MSDTVVITRPRAQAEALAQRVAQAGRTAVVLPLLEIHPLPDQSQLRGTLAQLDRFALAAFVSPNAVDAAFAHIGRWPAGVAVAVVGEGSRAALARHGVTPATASIHCPPDPAFSDSEHLLASLDLAALHGREVLIVRGETGRELMADALRAAGARVTTVAAYRRRIPELTPELAAQLRTLLGGEHQWVVTSSEALRGLAGLVQRLGSGDNFVAKLQRQHFVVPHARIEQTARELGLDQVTLTGSGDEGVFAALQSQV
jgi:uroporphyrinogen-III synthase